MTISIFSHQDCLLHDPTPGHPEQPARVKVIQQALKNYPWKTPIEFYDAIPATDEQLKLAHNEDYVHQIVNSAPRTGVVALDADTAMDQHTLRAARLAAGAVIQAVDKVMTNKNMVAFCNARPPGHHAERDKAMGFCFFNNLAIGVRYAQQQYHLKRIAIVDFDVHHGNGTQNIFQDDASVLLCSSFEHPFYPGYDPACDNKHILNLPISAGLDGERYRSLVERAWLKKLKAFHPQLIFFSAGFDAHRDDPLADINLVKEDYVWLTKKVAEIANEICQGRMVSVLEGGYNLEALAECVPAHVAALSLSS